MRDMLRFNSVGVAARRDREQVWKRIGALDLQEPTAVVVSAAFRRLGPTLGVP